MEIEDPCESQGKTMSRIQIRPRLHECELKTEIIVDDNGQNNQVQ